MGRTLGEVKRRRDRRVPLDKRKRVTVACDNCRQKKLKCRGGIPCERCSSSKYNCIISKRSHVDEPQYKIVENNETKLYICKLERVLQQVIPELSMMNIVENIDRIERKIMARGTLVTEKAQQFGFSDQDKLSNENEQLRSVNSVDPSFYSSTDKSFLEFIEKSDDIIDEEGEASKSVDRGVESTIESDIPLGSLVDALNMFPSAKESMFQINVFLKVCETNFYYVHPHQTIDDMELILRLKRSRDYSCLMENWIIVPRLLGILSISSGFAYMLDGSRLNLAREGAQSDHISYKYYKAALPFVGALINNANTESVQILLLLGVFMTTNKYDDASNTIDRGYSLLSLATELAVSNKLHLSQTYSSNPIEVGEFYKRIWWCCYSLERLQGLKIGKREIISKDEITVGLPIDVPELRQLNGRTNHENQSALIKLALIINDISKLSYRKHATDGQSFVTIDPSEIRDLFGRLHQWMCDLSDYCKNGIYDTRSEHYRSHIHLRLQYLSAKIYIGKPFLVYNVDNYGSDKFHDSSERKFIEKLTNICVETAFAMVDILSALEANELLGLYSTTDLNFCNISLFTIITYSKIDQTPTTLMFLRRGLKILKQLSAGSLSAKVNYSRLIKLRSLIDIQSRPETPEGGKEENMSDFFDSFPEALYIDNSGPYFQDNFGDVSNMLNMLPELDVNYSEMIRDSDSNYT